MTITRSVTGLAIALAVFAPSLSSASDEDREIVETSAKDVIAEQFRKAKAEDDKWIAAAQEFGMEYIVPTPEEKTAWVERVRAEVWPQVEEALGSEIMDVIRANATVPGAPASGAGATDQN